MQLCVVRQSSRDLGEWVQKDGARLFGLEHVQSLNVEIRAHVHHRVWRITVRHRIWKVRTSSDEEAWCEPQKQLNRALRVPQGTSQEGGQLLETLAGPIVRFPLLLVSLLHTQTRATRARYTRESQTRVDDSHVLSRDHAPLIIPCQLRRARSLITVRTRLTRVPIHSRTRPLMKVSSKRGGLGRLLRLDVRQTPRDDRLSGRQIWTPCPQLETKVAGALHQVETTPKKCPFAWPNWPGGSASFRRAPLAERSPPTNQTAGGCASGGCATLLPCADDVPPGLKGQKIRRARTAQRRARLTPLTVETGRKERSI